VNTNNRTFREFVVSCVFALFSFALVWVDKDDYAAREHIAIAGTLKEHELFGRRKSPTLHFKLTESELDFRVDPSLFRYAMKKAVPAGFQRGASVTVLVMKEEFDNPNVPLLKQDLHIAWVHGLKIDGHEIFGLTDTLAEDQNDRRWGYGLLACSLAAVIYFGIKWRRSGGPTNRSTRSRVKRAPG
jgi:hypothetical protein